MPSNRAFGGLFTAVFAIAGAWSLWRGGAAFPWWFGASAFTLATTLLAPALLAPFNRGWMALGNLLGRVVSPIVLGVIFFAVITPFGVIRRATGWDPMRRRYDPDASTYWIERSPPGPAPDSLPNQF